MKTSGKDLKTSSVTLFSRKIADLHSAKKEWSARLLTTPRAQGFRAPATGTSVAPDQNVVGVGVNEEIVDDKPTGVLAVKIFARLKYAEHELSKKALLPKTNDGLPVDVEETFPIQSRAPRSNAFAAAPSSSSRRDRSAQTVHLSRLRCSCAQDCNYKPKISPTVQSSIPKPIIPMFNFHLQNSLRSSFRALLLLAVFFAGASFLPNTTLAQAATPTPSPTPPPSPSPTVSKVEGEIKLHHTIAVDCGGLKEWSQIKGMDPAKLTLYLGGTQMKGLAPKIDKVNENEIFFRLERVTDENKADNGKAWDALFSGPKGIGTIRNVRVTIGPETGAPFDSNQTAPLCAIPTCWFLGWCGFSGLLLFGMVKLGRSSNLLRDSGDPPPGGDRKPYSLARWQMAFWFFFIVVAYLFIFMVTGAADTVTPSVLGLMGISASTGLAAVAVDNSKRAQARTELDKLKAEQAKLQQQQRLNALLGLIATQQANLGQLQAEQTRLAGQQQAATEATPFPDGSLQRLNALPGLIATTRANLDQLSAEQTRLQGQQGGVTAFPPESEQRLNALPSLIAAQEAMLAPSASQGFFYDILSDADGISFHRLQIAVWTVVLGIIFCDSIYHVLSMPNFSETLLGLMGISGGTYIGFKFPEKLS